MQLCSSRMFGALSRRNWTQVFVWPRSPSIKFDSGVVIVGQPTPPIVSCDSP